MFREVFLFELRFRLKQPMFYLFVALFFLMAFAPIATDSVQVSGAIGNIARNAPFVITRLLASLSAIGLIVVTVFVTSAVNRDHEQGMQELFFTTRLGKFAYLGGRFAGSLAPTMVAIALGAFGILVASRMPWQDPTRIVPFTPWPYFFALGLFVLPNLFFAGSLFFSVATLTRRVLLAWVAVVAFFSLWGISFAFLGNIENRFLASLIDPFGLASFDLTTRYWTIAEKSTLLLPVTGNLLLNRLIWTTVGICILVFTWARFRMRIVDLKTRSKPAFSGLPIEATDPDTACLRPLEVQPRFDLRAVLKQWRHSTRTEIRDIVCGIPFVVLMLLGVMNLAGNLFANVDGTSGYPVTRRMIRAINGGFDLFLFLVIVIYGAGLIWKERRAKLSEITDTLPVPNWMPLTTKLVALYAVATIALVVAMLTTIVFQIIKGYYTFELGLYLKGLFLVSLSEWILVGALAMTVHVLTNNRNLGFLVMILYFIALEVLPEFGFEHRLYYFGKTPRAIYSDMSGYGHYVTSMVWFKLYWGFLAAFLVLLSNFLWVRGTDSRLWLRLHEAKRRLTIGRLAFARILPLVASAAGFVIVGGWIFYNTNILNDYLTKDRENELSALYEKRYKQYEGLAQPRVEDVRLEVDIYPESRSVDIRGTLHIVNRTNNSIDQLHLLLSNELEIKNIDLPMSTIDIDDRAVGYRICSLQEPLAPGEPMDVHFDVTIRPRGFVNSRSNTKIVKNGTFFDNYHYIPRFGYDRNLELENSRDRNKYDLEKRPRALPVDDLEARQHMAFSSNADWITYEAVISTSADQIAITPGYLQKEWIENNRHYFHYQMDVPIVNFYTFVSGKYEVARDAWNDVAIEIYYHPAHHFNVGRMIEAIKKSLEYYTTNFGPYQFRQIRIIEFPGYRSFAQSFPNTIPYSETANFINDLRDEKNIDMVFFITAHETAHQWWGHQVIGADVQGAQMLIESITQYSAFMVMEKDYGRDQMQRFLAYELDRYLKGRGNERIEEQPLMLVESQPYIYYSKGGLALYCLRDYIGEDLLNSALRKFLGDRAYQDPPYTNSIEFLEYLREATPQEFQYLIEDLFETITLYDNRATEASAERMEDGRYQVTLTLESQKLRADGLGVETPIDHNDWIEIGVYGKDRKDRENWDTGEATLYLEKHRIISGVSTIDIIVDEKPLKAGIDPRNLLIDRVPDDNVRKVS